MHTDRTLPNDVNAWPADWRIAFAERAAILEFDGRMKRGDAERLAKLIVREEYESLYGR